MLSVIAEEETKVKALDEGADDYLTKPFGASELLARIRAVTRRVPVPASTSKAFNSGALTIDFDERSVTVDTEAVHLSPTEFNLLQYFVNNPGRVLRHDAILRAVWNQEYVTDVQVLRTYVAQLRSRLREDSTNPRFIKTEPGLGYRFIATDF